MPWSETVSVPAFLSTETSLEIAYGGQGFQFLGGVDGIRNQFSQEDFMIAVQEFLDNGEYVIGCYPNRSFLHGLYVYLLCSAGVETKKMPNPKV